MQARFSYNVMDVEPGEFNDALALFLKKTGKMTLPDWVDIVKTGCFKEQAPQNEDWFYLRAASIARQLYVRRPVGVKVLKRVYGGKKRRGVAPSHTCESSGAVIRKAMQSLETLKMVEKVEETGARRLSPAGRRDMERIAAQVVKAKRKALRAQRMKK